jgi:16S rRNA (guanine(527)-N(7))-methyltransferase RsmG
MKKKSTQLEKPGHETRNAPVDKKHDKREMGSLLERAGIFFSESQLEQLWSYHKLLREHNTRLNMTRIHNFTSMVEKLYVDSILPGQFVKLPSPLIDIGSGPGMPGIPLKIAFPETRIILAEGRGNRVEFLEMAVKELGLKNTSVCGKKIFPRFGMPVSGIITRAVEHIEQTLERIQGCLAQGGQAIFMKGPGCTDEIEAAKTRFSGSYRLMENIEYAIPQTSHERRLVVFERKSSPLWQVKEKIMADDRLREIESEQNNTFKDLRKLLTAKGIRKAEMALIAGNKIVNEAVAGFPERCMAWVSSTEHQPPPDILPPHMHWYLLSPTLFRELDVSGTNAPLVLIRIPAPTAWTPEAGFQEGCTMMIPFQDPENVGTIIRSAVAFGAKRTILLAEAAHPYHPKAMRASGGAVLRAEFFSGPSINDIPPDLPIVCLSAEGKDISGFDFPRAFGLLPGLEGTGIPENLRKKAVSIQISPDVESLNAATAAAIALYEWARR